MGEYRTNIVVSVIDKASKQLTTIGKSLGGMNNLIKGALIGGGVTAAFVGFQNAIESIAREAMEAQEVQAQLGAVLKSTGKIATTSALEVSAMADALMSYTRFSDEAIISGQTLLLQFENIGEDILPRASAAMADVATRMNIDLTSAARLVGKALNDPVVGLTALRRVGVQLPANLEASAKALMKVGDVAGAQRIVFEGLETAVGGAAAAAGGTFAGQLDILKNQLDNVKEQIGTDLIPVFSDLLTTLSPGLVVAAQEAGRALADIIIGSIDLLGKLDDVRLKLFGADWVAQEDAARAAFVEANTAARDTGKSLHDADGALLQMQLSASAAAKAVGGIGSAAWFATADILNMTNVLNRQTVASFDDITAGWKKQVDSQKPWPFGEVGKPTEAVLKAPSQIVDSAWKTAYENIKGYAASMVSGAQGALAGLLPSGQGDPNAPGANGPFENIFRAADVAVNGDQSQWAAKLGLDQATAQKIIADFQAGLFTEEVKALVDMPALVGQVQTKALADQLTAKFVADVAASAGTGTPVVESLLGVSKDKTGGATVAGIDTAVSTIATTLGTEWTGKAGEFKVLGKDFMAALIEGIGEAKGDVVRSVEDIANAMLSAMRAVLNVTITPKGGSNSNSGGGGGGNGNATNGAFNVTVNVSGGGDPAAIGRAVNNGVLQAARAMGAA